jgi:hypothetical protein
VNAGQNVKKNEKTRRGRRDEVERKGKEELEK